MSLMALPGDSTRLLLPNHGLDNHACHGRGAGPGDGPEKENFATIVILPADVRSLSVAASSCKRPIRRAFPLKLKTPIPGWRRWRTGAFELDGSPGWHAATFELPDSRFFGCCNGTDLRLELLDRVEPPVIASIAITKK